MKQNNKVTLGATGDILLHKRVYNKALNDNDKGYNFDYMLGEVKNLFDEDHLIIVNQESIIAGEEIGLSDFPHFNSPVDIGYFLKENNVDIVSIANNHIMDRGEEGVLKSIENWEKIGLPYVGANKSVEDQETLRIIHKNGLRICFLSYTNSSGTVKRPLNKKHLSNEYKDVGVKWLRRIIDRIRREKLADVVVLSIHYGAEYQMLPTAYQVETASNIADAGADIIIGHHPHVLQPPAFLLDSKGRDAFVAYSLGNFFSGQKGLYRQIGGYMTIDIEKSSNPDSSLLKIDNPTLKLTYVDSTDKKDYKLYLLKEIVENQKTIKTDIGEFDSKEVYDRMLSHMTKWIPNLDIS